MSQFKKYIGESENIPKPAEVARREKETLVTKLMVVFYWQGEIEN